MILPSKEILLPGGIRCTPRSIALPAWQAHVLKHPLGVNAARRAQRAEDWNGERWDGTAPPVVDTDARTELARRITALGDAQQRCLVPELRGKVGTAPEPECYACQEPLVLGCARLLDDVGRRYAAAGEGALAALAEGVTVPRGALSKLLMSKLRAPALWADFVAELVVMSVGIAARRNGWVVRFNRADGVRVELTLGAASQAQWRTTYREPRAAQPFGAVSFLLEAPIPDPSLSLSDLYAVPRGWWERHGS